MLAQSAAGSLQLPPAVPIADGMGDLLAFAGFAVLGLVVVATLVAGWELLMQQAATARLRAAVDTDGFVAAPGTAAAPSTPHADAAAPTVGSAAPGTAEAAAAAIAPAPAMRPGSGPVAERARDAARARDTSQPA
jgi:hypothetical protein